MVNYLEPNTVWKVSVFRVFWFAFSRIQTEYREILCISPYSVQIRENTDWKNSKYGHFSCNRRYHLVAIANIFYLLTICHLPRLAIAILMSLSPESRRDNKFQRYYHILQNYWLVNKIIPKQVPGNAFLVKCNSFYKLVPDDQYSMFVICWQNLFKVVLKGSK